MSKKIILLAGPTASGKSKLAIQLAKKINGEIINADSMQIFKNFQFYLLAPVQKTLKKSSTTFMECYLLKKFFSRRLAKRSKEKNSSMFTEKKDTNFSRRNWFIF